MRTFTQQRVITAIKRQVYSGNKSTYENILPPGTVGGVTTKEDFEDYGGTVVPPYVLEKFDYANSELIGLNGGQGWNGAWAGDTGFYDIISRVLRFSGDGTSRYVTRPIVQMAGDDMLVSFRVRIENSGGGNFDVSLIQVGQADGAVGLQFRGADLSLRIFSSDAGTPWVFYDNYVDGTEYNIQFRINFTAQTYEVQVNESGFSSPYTFYQPADYFDQITLVSEGLTGSHLAFFDYFCVNQIIEDFEDFTNGQDILEKYSGAGWSTSWYWESAYGGNSGGWFASNVTPAEDDFDVVSDGGNDTVVRKFPKLAKGIVRAIFKKENITDVPNVHFDIWEGTTFLFAYVISPDSGGIQYLYDGASIQEQIATADNTNYEIEVEFDAPNQRIRLRRGGVGDFSAWYTTGNAFAGVDTINLIAGGGASSNVHIDGLRISRLASQTNQLDGKNGGTGWDSAWTADADWLIQNSVVFEGSKALLKVSQLSETDKARRGLTINLDNAEFVFRFRADAMTNRWFFTLGGTFPDPNNHEVARVRFHSNGEVGINNGIDFDTVIGMWTTDTWYKITFKLNFTDSTYQAKLDDGDFSVATPFPIPTETEVLVVVLQDGEDVIGVNSYWDLLQAFNSEIPAGIEHGYLRPLTEEQASLNGIQFGRGFTLIVELDVDIREADKVVIEGVEYTVVGVATHDRGTATTYKNCLIVKGAKS